MTRGEVIGVIRAARGMNQRDLARACGIHPSYVCMIENKRSTTIGQRTIEKLAVALSFPEWAISALACAADTRHSPELRAELGRLLLGLFDKEGRP